MRFLMFGLWRVRNAEPWTNQGDLATAKKDEATSVTGFEELSAAKAAEISSATSAIEAKTKRSGEVAVEVVRRMQVGKIHSFTPVFWPRI